MPSRSYERDYVPREYLPESQDEYITFGDDTQLLGTGSANLVRQEIGFSIPVSQSGSAVNFVTLAGIFTTTAKTQRIDADFSQVNYESMLGYSVVSGIRKSGDLYYVTMKKSDGPGGGGTIPAESEDSQNITTSITMGDGSTVRGTGFGDSSQLTLQVPRKQGGNQRDFSWMATFFTNTSKTNRIRPQYSDSEAGDFQGYISLDTLRLDGDIYTVILNKA